MAVGVVLVASIIVLWAYILWSRRKFYALALKMPGPLGLPLIGVAHKIFNKEETLYVVLDLTIKYKSKTLFSWLGPLPVIYTIEPKIAETFLNSSACVNKSMIYDVLSDMLGDGLVTSKTPRWNKHRKLLSPSFKHNILLSFFPIFNKIAEKLCVEQLETNLDCGEVNLKDELFGATMKSAIATTTGLDTDKEESKTILRCYERLLAMTMERTLAPWLRTAVIYHRTKMYKSFMEHKTIINKFLHELVVNTIKELDSKDANKEQSPSENGYKADTNKPMNAFIEQATDIYQRNEFTFEDIMTEATLMLFASYETTATTLFSTIMCLAMHPQYQDRVFDEICTVFPDTEFDVRYENLKDLVYLDMCINETLRVASSIPIIARTCTADIKLHDDIVILKGTEIIIDLFNMHRDKETWGPEANIYNPDNFLPSNLVDKHKYSFIPFSKGPRNCIGWQYAGMFMKVMLVKVLRKYKFSTKFKFEDLKFVEQITLKYKEVPHIVIERR